MKNRLKVLRAERGWSQAVLGEKLYVSRQSINAIESGRMMKKPLIEDLNGSYFHLIEQPAEAI